MRSVFACIIFGIPVAIIGWFAIPVLVGQLIPKYIPSIGVMGICFFSGLLLGIKSGTAVFGSLLSWRFLYIYASSFVIAHWIFPWYFAKTCDPLFGVAFGGFLAAIIMAGVAIFCIYGATHNSMELGESADSR